MTGGIKLVGAVIDRDACRRWIAEIDAAMEASPILGGSLCMPQEIPDLSAVVKAAIIENVPEGDPISISDRWYYTRYGDARNGGTVEMGNHKDGTAWLTNNAADMLSVPKRRSNATLLLYLNDDFEGGRTTFMSGPPPCSSCVDS